MKMQKPPGIDLTRRLSDLQQEYHVSIGTLSRWRTESGISRPQRGRPKMSGLAVTKALARYQAVPAEVWAGGGRKVAAHLGVSHQAVYDMLDRFPGAFPHYRPCKPGRKKKP